MLRACSQPHGEHRGLEHSGQVAGVAGEPWVGKRQGQAGCCHVNSWQILPAFAPC